MLVILNPYTIFGNMAHFAMIPFILISVVSGFGYLNADAFFLLGLMVLISTVGVFVSFVKNIGQFVYLKVVVSLLIYLLVVHGIFIFGNRRGFEFNDFVYCAVSAVVINGLVIIFEVFFPAVRSAIEGFLVESGNVDWQEGFRCRSIASGGGASLSVLAPAVVVMALHLYKEKRIGTLELISSLFILLFFVGFYR
jgi:hypothetical protein